MGQRHQIFLIARVARKSKYRCIAALHHQWCFGRLPLRAAARFVALIQQKENAEFVREELTYIKDRYGTFGEEPHPPDIPCPYLQFLASMAWSCDLENIVEAYSSSSVLDLPAKLSTRDFDNDDGITIIDVSDPEAPAYCFVSVNGHFGDPPMMTPLSATQYVRAYHPSPEAIFGEPEVTIQNDVTQEQARREESVLNSMKPFESIPMISIHVLAETWPHEYAASSSQDIPMPKNAPVDITVPSLSEMTFTPAIKQVLETGDIHKVEHLLVPENLSKAKKLLVSLESLSNAGLHILKKTVKLEADEHHSVDLSGFQLTDHQAVEVLSQATTIKALNLSRNNHITVEAVRQILSKLPDLRRLLLFGTPVPNAEIATLVWDPQFLGRLECVGHPFFFQSEEPDGYLPSFTYAVSHDSSINIVAVPYSTTGQIVQTLIDYMGLHLYYEDVYSVRGQQPLVAACASQVREPGLPWGQRSVPFVPRAVQDLGKSTWTFVLSSGTLSRIPRKYAFLRRRGPGSQGNQATGTDFEILDLASFLNIFASEGHPAPNPELLSQLEKLVVQLTVDLGPMESSTSGCVMSEDDVQAFVTRLGEGRRRKRY